MTKIELLNKMEKIEMPSNIKYRIEKKGKGFYYPQLKKNDIWEYCTCTAYDQRDGSYTSNECFKTLEEAEEYIDDLIKSEIIEIYYKENWK